MMSSGHSNLTKGHIAAAHEGSMISHLYFKIGSVCLCHAIF